MVKFHAPEGVTGISIGGEQYDVVDGIVEVPEQSIPLLSADFVPFRASAPQSRAAAEEQQPEPVAEAVAEVAATDQAAAEVVEVVATDAAPAQEDKPARAKREGK